MTPGDGRIIHGATPIGTILHGHGDGTTTRHGIGVGTGVGLTQHGLGVIPVTIPDITPAIGEVEVIIIHLRQRPTVPVPSAATMDWQATVMTTPFPARHHAQAIARRPQLSRATEDIMEVHRPVAIPISARPVTVRQGTITVRATPAPPVRQAILMELLTEVISELHSRPATVHTTTGTTIPPAIPAATTAAVPQEDFPVEVVREGTPAEEAVREAEVIAAADEYCNSLIFRISHKSTTT